MTVLVTGATGLVGSRLLTRLVQSGVECRALVRSIGKLPAGVGSIDGDILDRETLKHALKDVSAIVHLAAAFRTSDEHQIWQVNLEGTRNLIAAAKEHAPGARFIMASTSHVYDAASPHPGREDDVVQPTLAYPASKVSAENELRGSGLNWAILRFPFVYGDGDGHLEDLPKYVAGKWHPAQRISTVHHRDIATAMNMALAGVMDGRIVNISDEAPTSVYELVRLVDAAMAPSSEPLAHPWHLHVDGSLARSLGFQPTVRTVYQAAQEGLL
jgi:nucleoside-diphosphate-sugar epimerase